MKGVDRRAVLGLAVAAAGALAACTPEEPKPPTSSPSTSDSAAPPDPSGAWPDTTPPPEGTLRVAESGWSHESKGDDGKVLSYGVILENTGDRVAFMTTATVRILDASGKDVEGSASSFLDGRVTVVLPGERVGFGATFLAAAPGIEKIEVELSTSEWWAQKNAALEFSAITVGEVATDRAHPPRSLMFKVTSGYTEPLTSTRAAAIFRDAEGRIVGGATAPEPKQLPSGRSDGGFTVEYGLPLKADPAKTEVHVPILT